MIKWRLVLAGLLVAIAAFVYVLADNLPDPQAPASDAGDTAQTSKEAASTHIEARIGASASARGVKITPGKAIT
ncbi:hypothetical protein HY418_00550 [Candidatus Kaiserbacteria bacterium]|nr:hypothetical protein [Candidatus Kaiserbacteria bacterium]